MTNYSDIIDRLEKATGPSAELGVIIKCALLAPNGAYVEKSKFNGAWCIFHGEHNGKPTLWEYHGIPNDIRLADPTASIDAAIALVERNLPGWVWEDIGQDSLGTRGAMVSAGWTCAISDGVDFYQGQARTLPIAILLALFRALQAQEAEA